MLPEKSDRQVQRLLHLLPHFCAFTSLEITILDITACHEPMVHGRETDCLILAGEVLLQLLEQVSIGVIDFWITPLCISHACWLQVPWNFRRLRDGNGITAPH